MILPYVLSLLNSRNFWSVNVVSLPLLYTYYFLFYTDVWSTIFVVAGIVSVVRMPNMKGALLCNGLGFMGLWFRQTNIIWIAFGAAVLIEKRCARRSTLAGQTIEFFTQCFKGIHLLVPFGVNAALFMAFIRYNGGITFGDKLNHQVSLHLVQVFYCWTFVGGLTLPLWFNRQTMRDYFKFSVGKYGICLIPTVLTFFAIHWIVTNFTIVHPFLLADNRHYTFYIYRRILSKPIAKYLVVPVYHFFTWLIPYVLLKNSPSNPVKLSYVGVLAFIVSTILTIIPSPLFEPRYYIVPLVLFRIFSQPFVMGAQRKVHYQEFVWYLFINAVVYIVFFSYEFTWVTEVGKQRIIW